MKQTPLTLTIAKCKWMTTRNLVHMVKKTMLNTNFFFFFFFFVVVVVELGIWFLELGEVLFFKSRPTSFDKNVVHIRAISLFHSLNSTSI